MSTYAAIFIMDEATQKFNGLTVKYDGYINNGVGEMLYKHWDNHNKALELIQDRRTDMRELEIDSEHNDWFKDENPRRYFRFRNLSYDQMLNTGGDVDYLYVMVPDDNIGWDWKVQQVDGFHSLSEYFPGE